MRALISVSDKNGVVEFAQRLRALGWEIIATGGTMKLLRDKGVEVINISDVTPRSATAASRRYIPRCTAVCWRAATTRATCRL